MFLAVWLVKGGSESSPSAIFIRPEAATKDLGSHVHGQENETTFTLSLTICQRI